MLKDQRKILFFGLAFLQIADGLAYMEKEKFIHRNLGARNILVGEKNKVKIAGFGMTKCADDPDFNFRRGKSNIYIFFYFNL